MRRPSRKDWAAIAAAVVACVVLGMVRGTAQSFVLGLTVPQALARVAGNIVIVFFWLPVALLVVATWLVRHRPRVHAGLIATLGLLAIPGDVVWSTFVQFGTRRPPFSFAERFAGTFDTSLVYYIVIVALAWAYVRRADRARTLHRAAELDAAVSTEQLHVLALQLHPHFLFNTLNLASQLVYSNIGAAREVFAHLRTLLLESLQHAGDRDVPLTEELRFLQSYLFIQQARFGNRLTVQLDVSPAARGAAVPHLMLQPLVENAIAHGIGTRDSGGRVVVTARHALDRLRITIEDDGVGLPARCQEGIGLTITRLRLKQLFGADASLFIGARASGGTRVDVDMPLREFQTHAPVTATSEPAPLSATEPRWTRWTRLPAPAQIAGMSVLFALLWLAGDARHMAGVGASGWLRQIGFDLANAALWGALCGVPIVAARRLDLSERVALRAVAIHLALAVGAGLIHVASWLTLLSRYAPMQFRVQWGNRFAWLLWDLGTYAAIVGFMTVASLGRHLQETAIEMERSRAELLRTRLAALRLRLQPSILFRALDAAESATRAAPGHAERVITRLGDLLRALLAGRNREYATLAEELEILQTFLDVVQPAPIRLIGVDASLLSSTGIPSTIAPAIAAALESVSSVAVEAQGESVAITFTATRTNVDLTAVRDRLYACYQDTADLVTAPRSTGGIFVSIRIPAVRTPALVSATDVAELATA